MTERLKRIQSMAQRYHSLGVVKGDTMESIKVTVATHRIPAVPLIERQVLGLHFKMMRLALDYLES